MSVVETMDPEYYPGAVQDHTGQWICSKYGSNGSALPNGTPKKVAYWERIPVRVQRVPGAAEWCHGRGPIDNVCSKFTHQSICDTKFPDPNEPDGSHCVVLLYDSAAAAVQIHDVINVIGVLDLEEHFEGTDGDDALADDFDVIMDAENVESHENRGANLPQPNARRVYRVHAMHVKILRNMHSSPYENIFIKRSMAGEFLRQMHAAAIDWLSRPFCGDRLCGELMLLQLLCKNSGFFAGRVARRMTLNIYNPRWGPDNLAKNVSSTGKSWGSMADNAGPPGVGHPSGTTSEIADAVAAATAAIYPYVNVLPVTDSTTANRSLFPYHDASANRLRTGMLQQAPHACIILDECILPSTPATAAHDAMRARNVRSLQTFLSSGVLEADYAWQQIQLPVSGSALVLATQPSAFTSTCHVSVCSADDPGQSSSSGDQIPLQGIRSYLASAWDLWQGISYVDKGSEHRSTNEWVQQKLVSRGKAMAKVLNGLSSACTDTMRAYEATVVLLHCIAVSHGSNLVSQEHWALLEDLVQRVADRGRELPVPSAQASFMQLPKGQLREAQVSPTSLPQQDRPALSAGEAMLARLRENGQVS